MSGTRVFHDGDGFVSHIESKVSDDELPQRDLPAFAGMGNSGVVQGLARDLIEWNYNPENFTPTCIHYSICTAPNAGNHESCVFNGVDCGRCLDYDLAFGEEK